MKFQTYTATPGLDRFPPRERFTRWQAAHRHLLVTEVAYRKRFNGYLTTMICLCIPLMGVYGFYFGIGLPGFLANFILAIGLSAVQVCLALRQMHFMNQSIGRYFQSHPAD